MIERAARLLLVATLAAVGVGAGAVGCNLILGIEELPTGTGGGETGSTTGSGASSDGGGPEAGAPAGGNGDGGGAFVEPRSCDGLISTCGALSESCCRTLPVPEGDFKRNHDTTHPAHVSAFSLDKFEVTVGRFMIFKDHYSKNMTQEGDGAPTDKPERGWKESWNDLLPDTPEALLQAVRTPDNTYCTAVDEVGNASKPITCVTWYEAFAFCVWDRGRLPTDIELNYVAAGGSNDNYYPWGGAEPNASTNSSYECIADGTGGCAPGDQLDVGVRTDGNAEFGQADLGGNAWERAFDGIGGFPNECDDCANTDDPTTVDRVLRGGAFNDLSDRMRTSYRKGWPSLSRNGGIGFRCARDP